MIYPLPFSCPRENLSCCREWLWLYRAHGRRGTGPLLTQAKVKLIVKDEKHGDLLLIGASDIDDNTKIFSVTIRVSKGVPMS